MDDAANRTKYVTVLENDRGEPMYVPGQFVGKRILEEGTPPYTDRAVEYVPVRIEKVGQRKRDAVDAVFDALGGSRSE